MTTSITMAQPISTEQIQTAVHNAGITTAFQNLAADDSWSVDEIQTRFNLTPDQLKKLAEEDGDGSSISLQDLQAFFNEYQSNVNPGSSTSSTTSTVPPEKLNNILSALNNIEPPLTPAQKAKIPFFQQPSNPDFGANMVQLGDLLTNGGLSDDQKKAVQQVMRNLTQEVANTGGGTSQVNALIGNALAVPNQVLEARGKILAEKMGLMSVLGQAMGMASTTPPQKNAEGNYEFTLQPGETLDKVLTALDNARDSNGNPLMTAGQPPQPISSLFKPPKATVGADGKLKVTISEADYNTVKSFFSDQNLTADSLQQEQTELGNAKTALSKLQADIISMMKELMDAISNMQS